MLVTTEKEETNNSTQKKKSSAATTRYGLRGSGVVVSKVEGGGRRKGRSSYNGNGRNETEVLVTASDRRSREETKSDRQQLTKQQQQQQQQQNRTLPTTTTITACNSGVPPALDSTAADRKNIPNGGDCVVDKYDSDLEGGRNEIVDERKRNEVVLTMTQESNAHNSSSPSSFYSGDSGSNDVVRVEPVENVVHAMEKVRLEAATALAPEAAPIPTVDLSSSIPRPVQRTQRKRGSIGFEGSYDRTLSPAFKILIPSAVAGCIIGKGGRIICQVQQETGTKIKLSQNHEFFPGTNDRVCLIIGDEENILVAITDILQRIVEFYHQSSARLVKYQQHPSHQNQQAMATPGTSGEKSGGSSGGAGTSNGNGVGGTGESSEKATPGYPNQTDVADATRSTQDDSVLQEEEENVESVHIKVLVPVAAADHLLREGNGALMEALTLTSATCVFTGKEESPVPHERVCALSGTVKEVLGLVQLIFSVTRNSNLGGGYIHMSTAYKPCRGAMPPRVGTPLRGGGGGGGGEGLAIDSSQDVGARDRRGTPAPAYVQLGQQQHQQQTHVGPLYSGGNYNVLSQEGGLAYVLSSGGTNLMGTTSQEQQQLYFPYFVGGMQDPSIVGMNGDMYPDGPPPSAAAPQIIQVQVAIPDFLVGVVLGKRGVNVMRIQKAARACIHISPRGEFVPGTTHRTVVIVGTLQAITAAQYLINQCMNAALAEAYNPAEGNVQHQQVPLYNMQQLYSSQYGQVGTYPQQQRGHFISPPPQVQTFYFVYYNTSYEELILTTLFLSS